MAAGEEAANLPFMQSKVDPERHHSLIWNAFFDLSGDRPAGAGFVGRIPFRSLDAYARRYGIDHIDEFERFQHLVRAMDDAFVEHMTAKITAAATNAE